MRIIAQNHDYYDCIQSQGQDRSLIYDRKVHEIEVPYPKWDFPTLNTGHVNPIIIGFCGKIYPLVQTHHVADGRKCCYNIDEADAFFEKHYTKRHLKIYHGKDGFWRWTNYAQRDRIVEFFRKCAEVQDKFVQIFMENSCPIFVATKYWKNGTIEVNAELKRYDFFRVFDPYTAFQEIAMFMSNIAIPQKPMPQIDDVTKAESKGFDKWSFRNPPFRYKE